MKHVLLIGAMLLLVLGAWGCGSDETAAPEGSFGTITVVEGGVEPEIHLSGGPPPKKTLVRDVKVGSGPVAQRGDTVIVYYFGTNFRTGLGEHFRWAPEKPWKEILDASTAWKESVEGMRVGGLREALIPSRLAFDDGAIDYITKLVAVKPAT